MFDIAEFINFFQSFGLSRRYACHSGFVEASRRVESGPATDATPGVVSKQPTPNAVEFG